MNILSHKVLLLHMIFTRNRQCLHSVIVQWLPIVNKQAACCCKSADFSVIFFVTITFYFYCRLALYVYEYLLHVGAQKSAQTFLSEVSL